MSDNFVTKTFAVKGMSCSSCELKLENGLRKQAGVKSVRISLVQAQAVVEYDPVMITDEALIRVIEALGYEAQPDSRDREKDAASRRFSLHQLLGLGIIIYLLYHVINSTVGFNFIPAVDQRAGYGMLFMVGLLTSLHCIAMCGGINISQCLQAGEADPQSELAFSRFRPSLLYNGGRVLSYTIVGGMAGALGSVVSFSGSAKGIVAMLAGFLMVMIGINMLDIFPWLKRFNLRLPKFFGNQVFNNGGRYGPFIVGLLNGLMPCGPLQTMQLYALGTGSFRDGAIAMFLFSLGTVPLMFGFGAISSVLSKKLTHSMLKASAVLVVVLGLIMVSRGLSLSGISVVSLVAVGSKGAAVATLQDGIQVVTTTLESGRYMPLIVQKGIPVRWTIKAAADDLNGCNNPITIPKYGIEKRLVPGDNIIEFTPEAEGNLTYTCWMGMISSTIRVVSDLTQVSEQDLSSVDSGKSTATGGSCCSAGAQATRFAGGRIPTDDIQVPKIEDGKQEVTITVNDQGFAPAVVVLQRGAKVKIKFKAEKLNYCNNLIVFPEYRGQPDLSKGQLETVELEVTRDFTMQCWMGMLNGYFKVVDNIQTVDLEAVKREIEAYRPASSGSCCR